jgi:hypothetical protein
MPVDNQHQKISGYRDLSQEEIDLMNELKKAGNNVGTILEQVASIPNIDQRWLSIGRTDIQKGFMAAIRSIARPITFC